MKFHKRIENHVEILKNNLFIWWFQMELIESNHAKSNNTTKNVGNDFVAESSIFLYACLQTIGFEVGF